MSERDPFTKAGRKLLEFAAENLPEYSWVRRYLALSACGFDKRLANALVAYGCNTPADVLALTPWPLTVIPNLGQIEAYRERIKQ
jgi:hypothetical protein